MFKRGAVEEFHDEEGASGVLADVVDGADIGMVQRRGGFGFAAETLKCLMILGEVVGKKLERDKTSEAGVFGLVDPAHAAAAEFLDDPVMRNGLVEQRTVPVRGEQC